MKINLYYLTLLILLLSDCNSLPKNNWTEQDKLNATFTVRLVLNANPTFRKNKDAILDATIKECITKYPNVNDFKKDSEFVKAAFSTALVKEFHPTNGQ
jgi:hypothetical protein